MLITIIESVIILVPFLLAVALLTICERKVMASLQRRIGPNFVGYFGLLQPIADAIKLLLKQCISPSKAFSFYFFIAPFISIITALFVLIVINFNKGIAGYDFSLALLYLITISSLNIYGVFFAGLFRGNNWSLLGSLRRTAQMIRYELVLRSTILIVIGVSNSYNFNDIIFLQKSIFFIIPLLPIALLFFISALAETNRTPFDLPEAESELVAGFFTEHASLPFVLFFLAEYLSILIMSALFSILFLGGYLSIINISILNIFIFPLTFAVKIAFIAFIFIWVRASLPRYRYDQLIKLMWLYNLPLVFSFIILVISILLMY